MVGFVLIAFNLIFAKRLAYHGKGYMTGASSMLQGTTDIAKGLKEIIRLQYKLAITEQLPVAVHDLGSWPWSSLSQSPFL